MEDNGSAEPCERVTLILGEERFEVEKRKLIDKSQYFAALLSANYVEYGRTEHIINYDISTILLQDFIHWIHNDEIPFTVTSCDHEELDRHLFLLELSVLFAVDNIIDHVIDRLERHFMRPKYAINIWLLARELNLNILRDLSLAICLDRLDEVPLNSIKELSRENFLKLFANVNVRSGVIYFHVIREWMSHHDDFTIPIDFLKNKQDKILHSIISHESKSHKQFIHCWDGNDFFELTSFEFPTDIIERSRSIGKCLDGMQITGRRYDLYLCGGEYGIGTGKFNRSVWRYSLISKKWFFVTNMPIERRHMITVFIKNKLLLVGGVGRYRQKLQSVDIYDIFEDQWTSGADMTSLQFTSVPEHFVHNEELIIYQFMPAIYIYFSNKDAWKTQTFCKFMPHHVSNDLPMLTLKTMPCYIDVIDRDKMILRAITETCNVKKCHNIIKSLFHTKGKYEEEHILPLLRINSFILNLLYCTCNNTRVLLWTDLRTHIDLKTLHLHNIPIRNPRKFHSLTLTSSKKFSLPRRFFHLLHPADMHATSLGHI